MNTVLLVSLVQGVIAVVTTSAVAATGLGAVEAVTVLVRALSPLVGAAAAFVAAAALYRMQKNRVAAGVVTTFSRGLLVVFALMMLTGLASLATLVPNPEMYMAFLGGGAITTLVALAGMRRRSP